MGAMLLLDGCLRVSKKEIGQRAAQSLQVAGLPIEIAVASSRLVEDIELLHGAGLAALREEVAAGVYATGGESAAVCERDKCRFTASWPSLLAFGDTLAGALVALGAEGCLAVGPVSRVEWVEAIAIRCARAGLAGVISAAENLDGSDDSGEEAVGWFDASGGAWGVDAGRLAGAGRVVFRRGALPNGVRNLIEATGTLNVLDERYASVQRDGCLVPVALWDELGATATQVYIPTSERSRRSGR